MSITKRTFPTWTAPFVGLAAGGCIGLRVLGQFPQSPWVPLAGGAILGFLAGMVILIRDLLPPARGPRARRGSGPLITPGKPSNSGGKQVGHGRVHIARQNMPRIVALNGMPALLAECRHNFGPPGRPLSFWDRLTYLRIPRPAWCVSSDQMTQFFRGKNRLLREGEVLWGHIIQANALIYHPGRQNVGGELVYPAATSEQVDHVQLAAIAGQLFSLKGTEPNDPELTAIARYLTDERIRVFGWKVPRSLSGGLNCAISTTFFARHHLPRRKLCCPLLPVIACPPTPQLAMPLPSRYWPRELIEWWSAQSL